MIDRYSFLRPWLFCLDPEQAHNLTLTNLDRAQRWGLLEKFLTQPLADPRTLCGITFPNPVGLAAGLDKKVIAETCIVGDELTCPLVGEGNTAEALPVIKIIPPQTNYDFHHKYFSNETQYLCPTGLAPEINERVQALALAAYRTLGCRTWGRADVMLDQKTGKPYLLEMNTSPGMTSHSLVPMAAKATGVSYADLVLWLLNQTMQQKEGATA
jgi:D-alanine-D-alanine ligase